MSELVNTTYCFDSPSALELSAELTKQQPESSQQEGYFVYHLDALKAHLAELQRQDVIKLWFAVKANPLSNIIKTLDDAGFNFDVASSGELNQVLKQGITPERILNTGPAKSKAQITSFIKQGVNIFVAESLNQLTWLNEAAIEHDVKPRVLLRVQLQWPEGEKNPLGGNCLTPFGLSIEQWQSIKVVNFPGIELCGLHIFQWGNMLSNEKMFSLWSQMVAPLKGLADDIGMPLKILDLGGGLGIDYLQQGKTLSWQKIIADLAIIKQQAGAEELWLELGRFAVAECGYYVVPVVDRKMNYGQEQLVLAAGINHLLRPAITEQPFPVNLLRESTREKQLFDIHGPLCTSMDKLGKLPLPDDVSVGDQLVFGYCGAYGFTESMPFFLCHHIAAEYVFSQGTLVEVRAAQPADWYLR
ncbi:MULTISPECIES: PLP-dependent decarboxylase [unclassified Colwellia]|uniref:PLP-dependent decarboxylase n=1 Tax=unclassified Colwellia TaxID=196834 RepID=UPI0015F58FAE|nr:MULTISPECIES: PLP-dependent decarboxylase [unclassified Colwellia]MBA6352358.1 PLP-dependent decarboxylase [Colwellia sp. BRX9-1]MBA6356026.1 PLP-dependent decarboxylase [Colwellia sp. BRX8-3]MBA6359688.1 PLP-dependent decarboxylase [Colwellia sp. BRX8-6]MBA6366275.1 PLP-dependent decarboxylase [Colwellia sp. BRX8-5]MBA6376670.1 PLP-dependent decarboxylase [Colwellia sp. BRX8-2]